MSVPSIKRSLVGKANVNRLDTARRDGLLLFISKEKKINGATKEAARHTAQGE
jgi:hypothetical protein